MKQSIFILLFYLASITILNSQVKKKSIEKIGATETITIKIPRQEQLVKLNKKDSLILILKKQKNDTNDVKCLIELSKIFDDKGNHDSAITYANKALIISKKISYKMGMVHSCNLLGDIYYWMGKYPQALEKHLLSQKVSEEIQYRIGIVNALVNIGNIHAHMKNFIEAKNNYLWAKKISEAIGYKKGSVHIYNNIGSIEKENKNIEGALKNHFAALKISEEMLDKTLIANCYFSIAGDYQRQKKNTESLKYYKKALTIHQELGEKKFIAYALSNIGNLYLFQKKNKEALQFCTEALHISTEINDLEEIKYAEENLSEIYSALGKYALAFEHLKKHIAYKDSLNNYETSKKIISATLNDKFEHEITKQKLEKEQQKIISEKEIKTQKIISTASILVVGLVIVLIIVMFRFYNRKIKTNKIISIKNEEIINQNANISGQEKERKRIAKELHDGVGGTLAGIKLSLINFQSYYTNKKLEEIITRMDGACNEVRTISHNLLPLNISNTVFVELMQDLVQKFIIPEKLNIQLSYFQEKELNNLPENIKLNVYRITQELLHNIVKYANANKVTIGILIDNNDLDLNVEDNGIGFDTEATAKGIGLKNIASRVQQLNGILSIDSKKGRGTAININFPLPSN